MTKINSRRIRDALVLTILSFATIHLSLALVMSVIKQKIDYFNPIDFLGISIIWPELKHSVVWFIVSWLFIAILFLIILLILKRKPVNNKDKFNV
jgi:hypothetical protein